MVPVNSIQVSARNSLHHDHPLLSKVSQYLVRTWMRDACSPCQVAATRSHVRGEREQRAEESYVTGTREDVI